MKSWLKFSGVCEPSRLAILQKSTQVLCTVAMALMLGKDVYFFDVSLEDASSNFYRELCAKCSMVAVWGIPCSQCRWSWANPYLLDGLMTRKVIIISSAFSRAGAWSCYPSGHSNPVAWPAVVGQQSYHFLCEAAGYPLLGRFQPWSLTRLEPLPRCRCTFILSWSKTYKHTHTHCL